jgi:hypothetical protein
MTQIIKGWTVGLIDQNDCKMFLGRYRGHDGTWVASIYYHPCNYEVFSHLFKSAEEALEFWNNCDYETYGGKGKFKAIPVEIELSLAVNGLGFDWNGI